MIKINREAKSRLSVPVETATDPALATVSFAFPLRGLRPSTFVAGTWFAEATFDSENGVWRREALTPRIGQDVILAANHYRFYGKLINGQDEDVWEIDEEGLEIL
jgi:hypothetical protein